MTKFALHDGENAVKRIAILALFRNNAKFLATYLLPKLVEVEASYDVDFEFYFLENNSSDLTKAMLELFLKDTGADGNTRRRGRLITLDLPDIVNEGINFERTARLSFLRNTLVDFVAPFEADKAAEREEEHGGWTT